MAVIHTGKSFRQTKLKTTHNSEFSCTYCACLNQHGIRQFEIITELIGVPSVFFCYFYSCSVSDGMDWDVT